MKNIFSFGELYGGILNLVVIVNSAFFLVFVLVAFLGREFYPLGLALFILLPSLASRYLKWEFPWKGMAVVGSIGFVAGFFLTVFKLPVLALHHRAFELYLSKAELFMNVLMLEIAFFTLAFIGLIYGVGFLGRLPGRAAAWAAGALLLFGLLGLYILVKIDWTHEVFLRVAPYLIPFLGFSLVMLHVNYLVTLAMEKLRERAAEE